MKIIVETEEEAVYVSRQVKKIINGIPDLDPMMFKSMMPDISAVVIEIDGRFFNSFGQNGRTKTAWSLSGACLFLPGPDKEDKIKVIEDKLKAKGKKPKRMMVVLRD
jgi:hypothetical protein